MWDKGMACVQVLELVPYPSSMKIMNKNKKIVDNYSTE